MNRRHFTVASIGLLFGVTSVKAKNSTVNYLGKICKCSLLDDKVIPIQVVEAPKFDGNGPGIKHRDLVCPNWRTEQWVICCFSDYRKHPTSKREIWTEEEWKKFTDHKKNFVAVPVSSLEVDES